MRAKSVDTIKLRSRTMGLRATLILYVHIGITNGLSVASICN